MSESLRLDCPHCGEAFETAIEPAVDDSSWVEDCPVCCRPILITLAFDSDGGLSHLNVRREND